jgi:hypothetical protein
MNVQGPKGFGGKKDFKSGGQAEIKITSPEASHGIRPLAFSALYDQF